MWAYLATVIDLASRRVDGWAMTAPRIDALVALPVKPPTPSTEPMLMIEPPRSRRCRKAT